MKELSIEEKARAYDEAIKYAHYLINERCKENTDGSFHRADLNKMFPELAESEDEKIIKWLIDMVEEVRKANPTNADHNGNCSEAIAWIEKQGKSNMGISESTKQKLEDNLNKALEKETPESCNEFLNEQNPAWSEEDELMRNNIIRLLVRISVNTRTDSTSPNFSYPREIEWLKSLKERYTWKPSDEQMKCLSAAIEESNENSVLESLLSDLKKLNEE